ERERDALAAKVSALGLALGQRDGIGELIAAELSGIRGLVADSVSVQAGFETAIAAALGSLAEALLADDFESATVAIRHAGEQGLGRVEVLVAEQTGAARADASALPELPGTRPAASLVQAPPGVLALLRNTVIADDLDAARSAWQSGL